MLLCSVNPSSHSALIPAHYAPISVVTDGARDIGAMPVSLLRDSMVSDGLSHSIIEYMSNRLQTA